MWQYDTFWKDVADFGHPLKTDSWTNTLLKSVCIGVRFNASCSLNKSGNSTAHRENVGRPFFLLLEQKRCMTIIYSFVCLSLQEYTLLTKYTMDYYSRLATTFWATSLRFLVKTACRIVIRKCKTKKKRDPIFFVRIYYIYTTILYTD